MSQPVLARHAGLIFRTLQPGLQRVSLLAELPGLLQQFDVPVTDMLKRAGLRASDIADPEGSMPLTRFSELLRACAEATGCPHFGLLYGSRWRLEHGGLASEFASSCATLGQALDAFAAFHWMNSSGAVCYLQREDGVTKLGYVVFDPTVREGLNIGYDAVMAVAVRLVRELTRRADWKPSTITFTSKRPALVAPYRRALGAPVRFDADATQMCFPTAFEATRLPGADDARRRALEARLRLVPREHLLRQLHRAVSVGLAFGLTSGDDIASAMGMTRRTFNRRLASCGTTFNAVLDEVRCHVAMTLLRDTRLAVVDIALALGYSDARAFNRAFGRWTGRTPAAWRRT